MLSVFVGCLPTETVFNVWDIYFCEGYRTVLIVSAILLKMTLKDIENCDPPETPVIIKHAISTYFDFGRLLREWSEISKVIRRSEFVAM
jgi:hypothetical protein